MKAKYLILTLFLIFTITIAIDCLAQGSSKKLEKVRISYASRALFFLNMYVAKDRGLYQENGLDAEVIQMAPGLAIAALNSGEVDYTELVGSTVRGALRGLPIKVVFVSITAPFFTMISKPQYKSIADLKTKIIGVTAFGGSNHQVTRLIFQHYGMNPEKDIKIIPVGDEQTLYQAIKVGRIDATAIAPPWPILAQKEGFNMLLKASDVTELPTTGLGTRREKIEKQRGQVKRMIKAEVQSLKYLRSNREGTIDVIMKRFSIDYETASKSYEFIISSFSKDGAISKRGIETLITFEKESGFLKEDVPISRIIDTTLIEEVLKELGG